MLNLSDMTEIVYFNYPDFPIPSEMIVLFREGTEEGIVIGIDRYALWDGIFESYIDYVNDSDLKKVIVSTAEWCYR